MKKQTRSQARETVFSALFRLDDITDIDEILADILEENPQCETNFGYISAVSRGVVEKDEELSKEISLRLKKGWTIGRISKSASIILKMAIYEMKYVEDVPPRVAINEAVELAKRYGTETDAGFVNGLLGNVFKDLSNVSGI